MTSPDAPSVFKHVVGKSTFAQGITVRRDYEAWFDAPGPGEAREISLLFSGETSTATLRRLANRNGTVQIRYEGRRHERLRQWLHDTFRECLAGPNGELLEVHKLGRDAYELRPVTGRQLEDLSLCLGPRLSHNDAAALPSCQRAVGEFDSALRSVRFEAAEGQAHYNSEIKRRMLQRGWEANVRVVPELPLQCDFRRDDCQIEVQFGNARSYYQDYLKFLLPFTRGLVRLGILAVPTGDFAAVLCAAGSRRAMARRGGAGHESVGTPQYSGMMSYEKAEREFAALKFIL